ncbi:hypothetical protein [Streptomyces sp. NBC_01506]|uniref:hypothetical protein n=1 Tax=Streptomyces sp. NBC_01506 TaxID=2903887 RepID=UPI00386B39EB
MLIASPWYESGSFWQFVITIIVAVALGALGAFATTRASNPKRRLTYRTLANTSLFVASHTQTGALSVTHSGTAVARPRVIELELMNAGRRDITAAQFHANENIVFDLGVEVVAVLEVASSPDGAVSPVVTPSQLGRIQIPPCLLVRKQKVSVSMLVDGPVTPVRCIAAPLIDVQVREETVSPAEQVELRFRVMAILLGVASTGLTVVAALQ